MVLPSMPASPVVWALHDGKAGMASQVLGLAEATGFPFVEKRLAIRFPWSALPPALWFVPFYAARQDGAGLTPPWPDLVIACGRNAAVPALAIKRASGGRTLSSLSFHSLRHSFNSALANAGVSQEIRQKLTGHTSAEMNTIYTHHELAPLRAAVEKLPNLCIKF